LLLLEAAAAQPLGAGTLEELQVVGVEDDAGRVGVFPYTRIAADAPLSALFIAGAPGRDVLQAVRGACTRGPRPVAGLGRVERESGSAARRVAELGLAFDQAGRGAVDEGQALVRLGAVPRCGEARGEGIPELSFR
jgi:hypothetical protein